MCGILGIYFSDNSRKVNEKTLKEATDTMHHRGPDDSGLYIDGNIGLGHRRLSIIDLSSGHQPMSNEDNSIVLPEERTKHFGQHDHVRIYSVEGLKDRLKNNGFKVQEKIFDKQEGDFYSGFKSPETVLIASKK